MTELDELKRRIETCHATIREQRAEIERLHACADELLSDLQRIDETSCLSDGDSVSVCVALWAGDWAKRMKNAGFIGCSEHDWAEETLHEPNFHVAYGAKRRCRKCGKQQFADYTAGRVGGDWVDAPKES